MSWQFIEKMLVVYWGVIVPTAGLLAYVKTH